VEGRVLQIEESKHLGIKLHPLNSIEEIIMDYKKGIKLLY